MACRARPGRRSSAPATPPASCWPSARQARHGRWARSAWPIYDGLGLEFATPETAAFISCTGLEDDTRETPEDYRERLEVCARRGLTMICANPDRVVKRGDQLIYCAGALADLYAALDGPVLMAGKPFAPIYDLAMVEAERCAGRPLRRERVLCIGDGLATDVKGAADQGLDCLFIAGGIHGAEAIRDGRLDLVLTEAMLAREGLAAAYAMATLQGYFAGRFG